MLLTGITGYLGTLVAATLLSETQYQIVAPIRSGHTREQLIQTIQLETNTNYSMSRIDFDRLVTIILPPIIEIHTLFKILNSLEIAEIIHCAGCVDYFDSARLNEANIELTAELISLGKKLQVKRFIYLSTAFSSGYVDGLIPETLHSSPRIDPTEYTRSKREAEMLVSQSSLPYLILRPSIVIGDSQNGHYSGKPYGMYQFMSAFEKLLCDRYRPAMYFLAPKVKLQILHQDAFIAAFLAAYHQVPDDSILHIVSEQETLPTVQETMSLWSQLSCPASTHNYYEHMSDVPTEGIDRRIKMWLEFTSVNSDIAAHSWQFETAHLDRLRKNGLNFADANLDTIRICQEHFVAKSTRIQTLLAKSPQKTAIMASI